MGRGRDEIGDDKMRRDVGKGKRRKTGSGREGRR